MLIIVHVAPPPTFQDVTFDVLDYAWKSNIKRVIAWLEKTDPKSEEHKTTAHRLTHFEQVRVCMHRAGRKRCTLTCYRYVHHHQLLEEKADPDAAWMALRMIMLEGTKAGAFDLDETMFKSATSTRSMRKQLAHNKLTSVARRLGSAATGSQSTMSRFASKYVHPHQAAGWMECGLPNLVMHRAAQLVKHDTSTHHDEPRRGCVGHWLECLLCSARGCKRPGPWRRRVRGGV